MGRRRNPPAKWVLPDEVDPPDTVCFQITVPNNPYHVAAFRGALYNLTSARFWQDDLAHTAVEVANVWRDIYDNIQQVDCNPTLNIDSEVDMTSLCELLRWNNGKLQAYCCGAWTDITGTGAAITAGAAQQPATPPPAVGSCIEFDALLPANGRYMLPTPVSGGDTIQITAAQGMTQDGSITPWACPDGSNNVLGFCVGNQGHVGGDPLASVYHMALIANINGTWYNAYNTTITVPSGLAPLQMYFQVNDGTISDNSGSIAFHIKVCHNSAAPSGNCLEYDFSIDAQGWATIDGTSTFGTYDSTNHRWQSHFVSSGGTFEQLRIAKAISSQNISNVKIVFSAQQAGYLTVSTGGSGVTSGPQLFNIAVGVGANQTVSIPVAAAAVTRVRVDLSHDTDAASSKPYYMHSIEICP